MSLPRLLVLPLLLCLWPASPAGAADVAPDAVDGAWTLAERAADVQARISASIERTLAPHNPVLRAVAGPRLSAAATFCTRYTLRRTADAFAVTCDGRESASSPLDGVGRPGVSPAGRAYTLVARADGSVVHLAFTADDGTQRTSYRVVDGALVVEKSIHSDRIDADVTWTARYARP